MQATQSNTASDVPHSYATDLSGTHAEATHAHELPGAFSTPVFLSPIQAARRYMDRQRSGGSVNEVVRGESPDGSTDSSDRGITSGSILGLYTGASINRDRVGSGQDRRDQDRRLERSLYEGHSIEAGLNYEMDSIPAPPAYAAKQRASLPDGDDTEHPFSDVETFSYPRPGAAITPDLGAVRGAILRLARDSRRTLDKVGTSASVDATQPGGPPLAASDRTSTLSPQSGTNALSAPTAFADVARRVWARVPRENQAPTTRVGAPGAISGTSAAPVEETFVQDTVVAEVDHDLARRVGWPAAGDAHRALARNADCAPKRIDVVTVEERSADRDLLDFDRGILVGPSEIATEQESAASAVPSVSPVLPEESALREGAASQQASLSADPRAVDGQTYVERQGESFEVATLAHDASNLLSALGLYSDLLNCPGVLDASNRHYAEELELIAIRSQSLINRLLRLRNPSETRSGLAPVAPEVAAQLVDPTSACEATRTTDREFRLATAPTRSLLQTSRQAVPELRQAIGPDAQQDATSQKKPLADDLHPVTKSRGSGAPWDEPWPISLIDLLMRWGGLLSTLAHGTLDVSFGPEAATPVAVAAESVERILVNLVKNARAATINGGAVRIGVGVCAAEPAPAASEPGDRAAGYHTEPNGSRSPRSSVVLTVDDSGCGMGEADVMQILATEHFTESEIPAVSKPLSTKIVAHAASRGSKERRGLGLRVVQGLVAETGGTFAIYSRLGRGTRVEIRWPSADPATVIAAPSMTAVNGAAFQMAPEAGRTPSSEHLVAPAVEAVVPAAIIPAEIGPDGFSEDELRSMMLRLHRTGTSDYGHVQSLLDWRRFAQETADGGLTAFQAGSNSAASGTGSGRLDPVQVTSDRLRADMELHSATGNSLTTHPTNKGALAC